MLSPAPNKNIESNESVQSPDSRVKIYGIWPCKAFGVFTSYKTKYKEDIMSVQGLKVLSGAQEKWRARPLTLAIMCFSPLYDEESTQKAKSTN